ncbi:hypothetical protein, partial [uncultured Deefgea sp.]|uniref:hypothetical protein n=1 Tax=uncultured Deefgea sp. TaxID=1304914 RepID=UPI002597413B
VAASRTSRLSKNQENEPNDSHIKPSAQQVSTESSIGSKTLEFAREQMRIEREIQNSNSTFIGQSHAHTKEKNLDIKELHAARAEVEASEEVDAQAKAKAQMVAEVEARLKKQEGMKPQELAEAQIKARAQARARAQAKMLLRKILWIISLFGLLLLIILYFSDSNNTVTDKTLNFSDFPVGAVYSGIPAKLVRDSELANNYRTRLGAALGMAPVFAGEYSQAFWGCGQECSITVFVNKRTGKVINQTFGGLSDVNLVDFKLDSSLVKAKGPLFDKEGNKTNQSAMYYFRLENEQLKLIQTAPIEKSADTKS